MCVCVCACRSVHAEVARGLGGLANGEAHPPPILESPFASQAYPGSQPSREAPTCSASAVPNPIISPEACTLIDNTAEFDYLTHIVFRMYEDKSVPVTAPGVCLCLCLCLAVWVVFTCT